MRKTWAVFAPVAHRSVMATAPAVPAAPRIARHGPGDYYSQGCIKLKPADIKNLFAKAGRYGWPKTLTVK
ncbi:hypothetical protein AB0N31_24575 [Streptomyces sp. NPDC051051]|uniref:hypothetical protein n=1 Tax=Streptomyces sp. NPDC051051 TaxID=3155666 RepID=UPI0034407B2A